MSINHPAMPSVEEIQRVWVATACLHNFPTITLDNYPTGHLPYDQALAELAIRLLVKWLEEHNVHNADLGSILWEYNQSKENLFLSFEDWQSLRQAAGLE